MHRCACGCELMSLMRRRNDCRRRNCVSGCRMSCGCARHLEWRLMMRVVCVRKRSDVPTERRVCSVSAYAKDATVRVSSRGRWRCVRVHHVRRCLRCHHGCEQQADCRTHLASWMSDEIRVAPPVTNEIHLPACECVRCLVADAPVRRYAEHGEPIMGVPVQRTLVR